jgi:hypothetical protein
MHRTKFTGRSIYSIIILLAALTLITGVTFASLQSQPAVLSSNTISTTTAFLMVSSDGTTFNNTKPGFTFANLTPGGAAVPTAGYNFYLKNTGTANLSIKAAISSTPTNPNAVDLSKVFLNFNRSDNSLNETVSVKTLMDSYASGGTLFNDVVNAGTTAQYTVRASMAIDAYSGSNGASISGIDLSFSGIGS